MNIRFNLLRSASVFEATLRRDGWVISTLNDEIDATHPEVSDEEAARSRLHRLGLLTSGSLRIEFSPPNNGEADAVS
jgi:hypothetical protein